MRRATKRTLERQEKATWTRGQLKGDTDVVRPDGKGGLLVHVTADELAWLTLAGRPPSGADDLHYDLCLLGGTPDGRRYELKFRLLDKDNTPAAREFLCTVMRDLGRHHARAIIAEHDRRGRQTGGRTRGKQQQPKATPDRIATLDWQWRNSENLQENYRTANAYMRAKTGLSDRQIGRIKNRT